MLLVKINVTKNNVCRSFTIAGDLYHICKQYMQARPQSCDFDRFFFKFSNGKCANQPIGINKFGSTPKEIAEHLGLPNPELYTGHSLRRTSTTLLVNAGGDLLTLKRHGGWKSSTVAEGYVADSITNKQKICQQITSGIVLKKQALNVNDERPDSPSTSVDQISSFQEPIAVNNNYAETFSMETSSKSPVQENHRSSSHHQPTSRIVKKNCITPQNLTAIKLPLSKAQDNQLLNYHQQTSLIIEKNHSAPPNHQKTTAISPSSSTKAQGHNHKSEVFYDPHLGLCFMNQCDDSNTSYVFQNCNVTIQSNPGQQIIFKNCNITYKNANTEE